MVCIITILTKATETEYNDLHAQLQRDALKEVVNMFALWLKLSETLFFCNRWLTYVSYRATQRLFINSSVEPSFDIVESSSKGKHKLSQHEEYRKASLLTSELASVASGASHVHFDRRLQLLKDLIVHWRSNQEVTLVEVDKGIYMYTLFLSWLSLPSV